ncbi:MAG: hypothetical protein CSA33_08765 [Desulfobulbus propionicus]|nr:MAG: hypothetical protein CSA33_08765 [Desulfobulbus propionicus]
MSLYRLEEIRQQFKDRIALNIELLNLEPGKIHALLGANGSGKTTLLDILAFLRAPTSGRMYFQGRRVNHHSRTELLALRRQVVQVDQHPIMFSTTVYKNIDFGLKIRKIPTNERRRIIDHVLALVSLERYRHAAAHRLSGGETQRLSLARALALQPQVLLCDEPTASVDSEHKTVLTGLLHQVNQQEGTTIVLTTHDRLQAAAIADHTVVLENGKLASTLYENCYSCKVISGQNQNLTALLHGKTSLPLPTTLSHFAGSKGRLYIDPYSVKINHKPRPGQKAFVLDAVVVLLMQEEERIRMVLDIGVHIVTLLSMREYEEIQAVIGKTVTLTIPPKAIQYLPTA